MVECFYIKKSYVDWLKVLLENNGNFIRAYNYPYLKNTSEEDNMNFNKLFMFFGMLLEYSIVHKISNSVLEVDIAVKYGDTYMCLDYSIAFEYENMLFNIIVLELGGSSDMIIRTVDIGVVSCEDIININDFYYWLGEVKTIIE